nr:hypothetical protein [Tanacetum cinerariifolium]
TAADDVEIVKIRDHVEEKDATEDKVEESEDFKSKSLENDGELAGEDGGDGGEIDGHGWRR